MTSDKKSASQNKSEIFEPDHANVNAMAQNSSENAETPLVDPLKSTGWGPASYWRIGLVVLAVLIVVIYALTSGQPS